jgi:hypothetical protein
VRLRDGLRSEFPLMLQLFETQSTASRESQLELALFHQLIK